MSKYKINNKIRLIELFGGIGSQAMALRDIGANFESYKLIEFDKNCIKAYNSIHNTNYDTIDITTINGNDLEIVDKDKYTYLMTYSFPCQDLSLCGKGKGMKKGSGTRSCLLWEVERILDELDELPQILLMENVSQVHSKSNIDDFNKWIEFLKDKGYSNFYTDLVASDYNVAQSRKRCFMISILGDYEYSFPSKITLSKNTKNYLDDTVDSKYYMYRYDINGGRFYSQAYEAYDSVKVEYGDTIDAFNKKVDKSGIFKTITTRPDALKTSILVIDKDKKLRKITPLESWRIMGFKDEDFYKASKVLDNKSSILYKQAGNSIVKQVLEEIFKSLI